MYQIKSLVNSIDTSNISILFIGEGYIASQEQEFYEDIIKLYEKILGYECFNSLKIHNTKLSIHALFVPSASSNIATVPDSGNTAFDSYIDSSGLNISYSKLEAVVQQASLIYNQETTPLTTFLPISVPPLVMKMNGTIFLPVFLFPANIIQGEIEFFESGKYYFVGTTQNGHYEQVIIRGMARVIGLGDEFDIAEPDFFECSPKVGDFINMNYFNLFYTEDGSSLTANDENFKWMNLFPQGSSQTINYHAHPSNGTNIDRNFPMIPLAYKTIELWEGGGWFRKKVFRSAVDCLQRRKIGNVSLPIKNEKISLCPVCRLVIKKSIEALI